METFRIIYANSLEEIDFDNFGNHFSSNEDAISKYFATGSSIAINGQDNEGKEMFFFVVEINERDINTEATEISNTEHPDEYEVVMNVNSEVKITEVYNEAQEIIASDIEANTGTRIDEWVK